MSFKKLSLDRAKLHDALSSYSPSAKINGPTSRGKSIEYSITMPGEKEALIHLFYLKTGETTIHPAVGKNQPLSIKIAEFLRDTCCVRETNRGHLYIGNISEEHFNLVCEFLRDECRAVIDRPLSISSGKQYKVRGRNGDTLSFNYFNNGALQVQGKPIVLFSETIEILTELLPYSEIVAPQLKIISADITEMEITAELKEALPSAFDFLGDKVRAIVAPALAWLKIDVALTDYSSMVFPALRGLEGYLKLLFAKHDILIRSGSFVKKLKRYNRPHSV